jgi:hypothetical protein
MVGGEPFDYVQGRVEDVRPFAPSCRETLRSEPHPAATERRPGCDLSSSVHVPEGDVPHPAPQASPGRPDAAAIYASAEALLRGDPAGVYDRSDRRTQWQYHGVLADWERRTGLDRLVLLRAALVQAEAAMEAEGADAPGAHVGYYLVGDGARALQASVAAAGGGVRMRPDGLETALFVPFSLALTSLLVAACATAVHLGRTPAWAQVLAVICAVPLASVYASGLVRLLPWRRRAPFPLPRLRAEASRTGNEATLVVVPAVVPSPQRARELVQRLWTLSQAHPLAHLRFALLSDFTDAPAETAPGDDAILAALRDGIAALNVDAGDGLGDRFFALHRRRAWSTTEEAWIGWERKRGKLREVMRLLGADARPTTFAWRFGDVAGLLSRAPVPYVIALDEASWLLPGGAAELIRTAGHPLNRPVVNAAGRVTSGYTVLQPAVRFSAPPPAGDAGEHAAPAPARTGGEPSFHFTSLGVGIHKGAGALYHVEAFRRAIDGAFPDERVLHHDLLDGFVGRTGEVPEARVHQPWPRTYPAQAQRGHRWLRGLFQALPFVVSGIRAAPDNGRRNPLTGLQRFLIADMALREWAAAATLVYLLLAWTVLPGPPAAWTLLACPGLLGALASLAARTALLTLRGRGGRRRPGPGAALARLPAALFALVIVVHHAWMVVDAFARVAWRLLVSQKRLLEWAPRHGASLAAGSLSSYGRALWPSPVVGVATVVLLATVRPAVLPLAAPFALAWIVAPVVVAVGDRFLFGGDEPA